MQTMVPLYGFGGGGGTGATLTVNAPAGCTVTVSKDGKTKTRTAGADGTAVFRGLSSGEWTLAISDEERTARKAVTIKADYSAAISFYTVHVVYPSGAVCSATDGVTTLMAPDTSGTWDCPVTNAGTWTVSLDSGFADTVEVVDGTYDYTVDTWHIYKDGSEVTAVTGGWTGMGMRPTSESTATKTAPTITREDTSIKATMPSTNKCGLFYTAKKIDLTNFSKLTALGEFYNSSGSSEAHFQFGVWSDISSYANTNRVAYCNIPLKTKATSLELDISGVTGECYVGIYLNTTGDSRSHYATMTSCALS